MRIDNISQNYFKKTFQCLRKLKYKIKWVTWDSNPELFG